MKRTILTKWRTQKERRSQESYPIVHVGMKDRPPEEWEKVVRRARVNSRDIPTFEYQYRKT